MNTSTDIRSYIERTQRVLRQCPIWIQERDVARVRIKQLEAELSASRAQIQQQQARPPSTPIASTVDTKHTSSELVLDLQTRLALSIVVTDVAYYIAYIHRTAIQLSPASAAGDIARARLPIVEQQLANLQRIYPSVIWPWLFGERADGLDLTIGDRLQQLVRGGEYLASVLGQLAGYTAGVGDQPIWNVLGQVLYSQWNRQPPSPASEAARSGNGPIEAATNPLQFFKTHQINPQLSGGHQRRHRHHHRHHRHQPSHGNAHPTNIRDSASRALSSRSSRFMDK